MGSAESTGPSVGVRVAIVVAGVGVLFLLGLLGREIFARPTGVALDTSHEVDPVVTPSATNDPQSPLPTSRVAGSIAHSFRPAPSPPLAPAASASAAGPVLDSASALAAVVTDPRAMHPQNIVPDRVKHTEEFSYEVVAPFRSMQLTKDTTNAQVWRLEGMKGPKLAELGASKDPILQKDDQGNTFATWYAIDTGPLAPAFATQMGDQVRIVSRAYLQANRADFPPSVTAVLDH